MNKIPNRVEVHPKGKMKALVEQLEQDPPHEPPSNWQQICLNYVTAYDELKYAAKDVLKRFSTDRPCLCYLEKNPLGEKTGHKCIQCTLNESLKNADKILSYKKNK